MFSDRFSTGNMRVAVHRLFICQIPYRKNCRRKCPQLWPSVIITHKSGPKRMVPKANINIRRWVGHWVTWLLAAITMMMISSRINQLNKCVFRRQTLTVMNWTIASGYFGTSDLVRFWPNIRKFSAPIVLDHLQHEHILNFQIETLRNTHHHDIRKRVCL